MRQVLTPNLGDIIGNQAYQKCRRSANLTL